MQLKFSSSRNANGITYSCLWPKYLNVKVVLDIVAQKDTSNTSGGPSENAHVVFHFFKQDLTDNSIVKTLESIQVPVFKPSSKVGHLTSIHS